MKNFLKVIISGYFLLCCMALAFAQEEKDRTSIRTVVIDAGHGGKDIGAPGKIINEKNITLQVALKLGKLIKEHHPSVKVVYTRDSDTYLTLNERSDIANKHNADLFISIHANSMPKGGKASGSETFVMGLDKTGANMEVAKRENAVITFEEDYSSKYEGYDPNSPESFIIFSLMQNSYLEQSLALASLVQEELPKTSIKNNRGVKQAGFLVLWRTAMPSVLIELGFISNSADEKILAKADGQEQLARAICKAFTSYKEYYEKGVNYTTAYTKTPPAHVETPKTATEQDKKKEQPKEATSSSNPRLYKEPEATVHKETAIKPEGEKQTDEKDIRYYRVQIIASPKRQPLNDSKAAQYGEVREVREGNLYKLTVGNFTSLSEANTHCQKVRKTYPDAFVVCFVNGKKVPLK